MSAEIPPLAHRGLARLQNSPLTRFLAFVRPHLRLASGAGAMGVAKYTLPLTFPLAFKYIIDVLVVREPRLEPINTFIDHLCVAIAGVFGMGPSMISKLVALAGVMTVFFMIQAAATYCAEYWSGIAGNRMILDLRCKMFRHLQTLSHSF